LTAILRVDRKITNHRTVSRGMDVSPPGPWTCSTTFPAYSVKKPNHHGRNVLEAKLPGANQIY